MRILIVNDDGIQSPGIHKLAEVLSTEHSIVVVAPHTQKSGYSHSLSFHKTITYAPFNLGLPVKSYSLTGTPCDCVKFAVDVLMRDSLPDVILCGINDDYNLGTDVVYSATVNAALEGTLLGFPSFAVSIGRENADDFTYPANFVKDNLNTLLALKRSDNVCFSINFPSNKREEIKGVRFATLGLRKFSDRYELQENRDGSGYLLLGEPIPLDNSPDSDVELIKQGYITITPVSIQDTAREFFDAQAEKKLCI
ncbi:MAG TPA: 5'/3'-nucleotidase SurE [Clostridiales bacterium]|nr:5'/3'-nucleotidase SurE [Clostridiales bacterium]